MNAKGKVVEEKGRYFVQVGAEKHELVPGALGGVEAIKGMVGLEVDVALSAPQVIAVISGKGRPPFKRPCFICYVPADPWQIWEIDQAIRNELLQSFVREGLIPREIADAGGRR
jgi:hypothetical protein